jgi:hypothetical protein
LRISNNLAGLFGWRGQGCNSSTLDFGFCRGDHVTDYFVARAVVPTGSVIRNQIAQKGTEYA